MSSVFRALNQIRVGKCDDIFPHEESRACCYCDKVCSLAHKIIDCPAYDSNRELWSKNGTLPPSTLSEFLKKGKLAASFLTGIL